MHVLVLALLTALPGLSAGTGAEGCPSPEGAGVTVEACCGAEESPEDGGREVPCSSSGGCCAVCLSCCSRAASPLAGAWSGESAAGGPTGSPTGVRSGVDLVVAVWHPPRG